jgi:hypothetical protein
MNILFLDQYADLGGGQRCLLDVVKAARQAGWSAHAALPGAGALSERLRESGVPVSTVPCGPFAAGQKTTVDMLRFAAQWPALIARVSALIEAQHPDVLYINGPRMVPAACIAALRRGVPVLFHCHSLLAASPAWLVAESLRVPARISVIAGSRFVARPLSDKFPVREIYNGVPDCSLPARTRRTVCRRIGVIGRIAPEKGQLEFVQAVRMIAEEAHDIEFVICGEPLFANNVANRYARAVREHSAGLPLRFLDWRDDVREVLADLDLLVVPSPGSESTTRVILEAYSARVPVMAFRSGGIPEVVEDGVGGILVDPPTAEALATALRRVIRTDLTAMAETARNLWKESFTVERFTRQILEAIEALAATGSARLPARSPVSEGQARPTKRWQTQ